MAVFFLPAARADLAAHKRRRENAATRKRFAAEIRACVAAIRRSPTSFAIFPNGDGTARVAKAATFPHLLLFRTDGRDATIITVLHGHSGPEAIVEALARR